MGRFRMRTATVLLPLLLCLLWTWAQGEYEAVSGRNRKQEVQFEFDDQGVKAAGDQSGSRTYVSADIWAELKELRDMAVQHRSKIEKLEQESTATQARLTASESKNAVLEARLSSSEKAVEELKRENADLLVRVTASENKSTVLEARLSSSEKEVVELKRENAVLVARLSSSEKEVEELKREKADRPKVAFSVGLTDAGQVGPFNTNITLKFSKVVTNFGQAYNPTTGIFTAPVRGVYYFKINVWDNRHSSWMGAELHHNDKRLTWIFDFSDEHGYVSVSQSLVLQLEKGDVVYVVLSSGYGIYDASYNLTNFSGFLLFAL